MDDIPGMKRIIYKPHRCAWGYVNSSKVKPGLALKGKYVAGSFLR